MNDKAGRPRQDGTTRNDQRCEPHRGPRHLEGLPDLRLCLLWRHLLRLRFWIYQRRDWLSISSFTSGRRRRTAKALDRLPIPVPHHSPSSPPAPSSAPSLLVMSADLIGRRTDHHHRLCHLHHWRRPPDRLQMDSGLLVAGRSGGRSVASASNRRIVIGVSPNRTFLVSC